MSRRLGFPIAVGLFAIYCLAPTHQVGDARYSLLLSHSLLFNRSPALDPYFPLPVNIHTHPAVGPGSEYPYQTIVLGGHVYYFFPPGGSLLALPAVAVASVFGVGPTGPGRFDYNGPKEIRLQRVLAAAVTALWGWLVFQTARLRLPLGMSALVALSAGLGTQAMSTASRALWSDTWGLVLLQGGLLAILRAEATGMRPRPLLLGTLLGGLYLVRPTYSLAIAAVLGLLATWRWWRTLAFTVPVIGVWFLALVLFSRAYYGSDLPPYYSPGRLTFANGWTPFLGNLVSPARGLFVYVPATLFVLLAVLVAWRAVPQKRVTLVAIAAISAHLVATSGIGHWWGGWSFGPRLMLGTLPWFVLLAVQALAAWETLPGRRRVLAMCAAAALVGVLINVPAACSYRAERWNGVPTNIDEHPERLWDWRDPQFLRAFRP
jgi:hypothetical protein